MSARGDVDGRVAIVTGAAKGIGAAVAEALAREGAHTILVDRDPVVRETAAALGASARPVVADISTNRGCIDAVAAAVEMHGAVHILVNNAGIQRYGTVVDTDEDTWAEVLNINLTSIYRMSREAVPHMRRSGGGSIVNVASVQAFMVQPRVAAYATSKGAAVTLTRSMAVDLAPDIRVNCVCPGSIDTPMLRESAERLRQDDPAAALQEWGARHPMGRVGTGEEVAQCVLWLAGPRSSFTTGSAHLVDGGLLSVLG